MATKKMDTIRIDIDGDIRTVLKSGYIKAKTKMLQEFGYTTLTEKEVEDGLEKALNGNADEVISMFIESDLAKD